MFDSKLAAILEHCREEEYKEKQMLGHFSTVLQPQSAASTHLKTVKGYSGNANPRHAEPQETPSSHDPLSTSQSDLPRVSNVKNNESELSATYMENRRSGAAVVTTGGGRDWDRRVAPVSTYLHRRRSSSLSCVSLVEHDGLWILVHHLSHVSQNVLLGDDAQETPGEVKFKHFQGTSSHHIYAVTINETET